VEVDVSITPQQHQRGLMQQKNPRPMVFLFPQAEKRAFWMKDTEVPLMICFAKGDGVFQVSRGEPFNEEQIVSLGESDMVIEIPEGKVFPKEGESVKLILSMETLERYIDTVLNQ
jgi:uncharacterized membrane protein (UPF0127 family)